jgi:hypothetical protein
MSEHCNEGEQEGKWIPNFSQKPEGKSIWGNLVVDGRIILQLSLKKTGIMVWTGSIRPMILSSGGLL